MSGVTLAASAVAVGVAVSWLGSCRALMGVGGTEEAAALPILSGGLPGCGSHTASSYLVALVTSVESYSIESIGAACPPEMTGDN